MIPLDEFIKLARKIARYHPSSTRNTYREVSESSWFKQTEEYEDPCIIIVRATDSQALNIAMKQPYIPVLILNPDGDVFRCHGQWTKISDHVNKLASSIPTTPIALLRQIKNEVERAASEGKKPTISIPIYQGIKQVLQSYQE